MKVPSLLGKRRVLTERQELLLERERSALTSLRDALQRFGADVTPHDMRTLNEALAHLDELFLLVIAGEFNSGKSSFINALLGDKVLREGVTPTTDRITLLRYGTEAQERNVEEFLIEYMFPATVLEHIAIVDTPGTNAIIRRHEELTRDFIPRSDLVLFVTSADRPFTESERSFLAAIQEWGKKIIIILNKVDLLETDEVEQVINFIRENARDLLGFTPQVFPISARLAQRARNGQVDEALWQASNFETVEQYILETLDEEQRLRLKLLSPIGVAQHLTDKYLKVAEGRLETLQQDFATLDNIERQLSLFRDDLGEDFVYHQTEVENILNNFELRGMDFFDNTIRLGNIMELRHTDRVSEAFEREVLADVPQQIEQRIQGLIDWMIEKNLRLWQSIMDYLQRNRVPEHRDGLIGDVGGSFDYNRAALIDSVALTTQQVVNTYDREAEARAFGDDVRNALAATALTEAGAVGIGALLIAAFNSIWLDVTGILTAGLVALAGFYVLPNKRRQVKRQLRERINTLREQLLHTMQQQFDSELDKMIGRIREAIAPYTRFIRTQREHLTVVQGELSDIDVELGRIRSEIGK
ncbi:MAG: dynamin [Chloroflexi bacterium AL-W]|nr:dynamin [Chloroflexi bacterium AL-N1]NOK68835.1 dynamin [Chloroflexi bacterium AL-N10]NOK76819.1 dynamin [Chloroflexi bacterium AL-N5]NOK82794.1 dynamin [Chloroflexi bacterium AL-W]NOK90676.1 dynamin [Chloroflexi bacterium AL-N15]